MAVIKKFFGLALLVLGLAIIFYGLYNSYSVFNARKEAPVLFEMASENLQTEVENAIREQLQGLLPSEFIPRLFNLIAFSIFAGILVVGGGQIAVLGIKLLK